MWPGSVGSMAGSNLVVPVVMWGRTAPSHCVSCVYLMRDQRTMVTITVCTVLCCTGLYR